jgi:hypothetical protein
MTYTLHEAQFELDGILVALYTLEDQTDYQIKKISEAIEILKQIDLENWNLARQI